jgi:hypothetical protein
MNAPSRGAYRALAILALPLAVVLVSMSAPVAGAVTPASVAREARQFWTPARMRQAKPVEVQAPGRVLLSTQGSGASASSAFGEVSDPTTAESRWNGVIFFRVGHSLGRCSGTSVNAPNSSVVITAAHCVNSGGRWGQWYRNQWVFVPGYRYGQRPFGVFPAIWLDTTRPWRRGGSENFDVGAAAVARNAFDVHGYPVAPPFDGETQRLCPQTPFLGHDPQSFLAPGPLNLAVDCDVTGGASGGGWTIRGDVLNGVTNYGYRDDPATDFGAYFGKEVGRLYGRAGRVG